MKTKKSFGAGLSVIRMIGRYEPVYLPISACKVLIQALMTWMVVWFPKRFIELLSDADSGYDRILKQALLFLVILAILDVGNVMVSLYETKVTDHFAKQMRKEIGIISMRQPFWEIESPKYREKLSMANNITNILKAVNVLESVFEKIVTSAGLAVLLMRYDWRFCVLVLLTLSVKVLFVEFTVRYHHKRRLAFAQNEKTGNYLTNTAYNHPGAAKEIRINGLSKWFLKKVQVYRDEMLSYQFKGFQVSAVFDMISAAIWAGQNLMVLIVLADKTAAGVLSIADFTMYFTAITTITAALSSVVTKLGEYQQYRVTYHDFSDLSETVCQLPGLHPDTDVEITMGDICFENVSFGYPNSDNLVLKNINLTIHPGEKLSVVGPNGAGKSTFLKLLCKFYKPTEGKITVSGKDIWEIDNAHYYKLLGAVFQDYVNFAFSIRENITLNSSSPFTGQDLSNLADIIDFGKRIEQFPQKFDTVISRKFDSAGINLSGGEEQKVAILRAVCRQCPITLLDEPTRALDAKTEAEMYDNFFRMMKGKTTIFISHRLASSVVADHILVLVDGQIREYGTHEALMKQKSFYREMYRKQSEAYN